MFRSFSSKPAGYLGPSGLFGSTGVPGVFGWSGVTGTTRSLRVTLNSWSVSLSLSNLPPSGYVLDTNSYPLFSSSCILALTSASFVNGVSDPPCSVISATPGIEFPFSSTNVVFAFWIAVYLTTYS